MYECLNIQSPELIRYTVTTHYVSRKHVFRYHFDFYFSLLFDLSRVWKQREGPFQRSVPVTHQLTVDRDLNAVWVHTYFMHSNSHIHSLLTSLDADEKDRQTKYMNERCVKKCRTHLLAEAAATVEGLLTPGRAKVTSLYARDWFGQRCRLTQLLTRKILTQWSRLKKSGKSEGIHTYFLSLQSVR